MKIIFAAAILSIALSISADIMPPNVHYIAQKGMIDNIDTLRNSVCTIEIWCSYIGPPYRCADASVVHPDSFFRMMGPTKSWATQEFKIFNSTAPDTQVIYFLSDNGWVGDSSPLIQQEYHFRLYYDWQGKTCLAKVKLISTYNNGFPPDTQTFPLPTAVEHSAKKNVPPLSLKCDPTGISFHFSRPQSATVQVTDINGRIIKTMKVTATSEGRLPFPKLAAGTYFVKLDAQDGTVSQQVSISK